MFDSRFQLLTGDFEDILGIVGYQKAMQCNRTEFAQLVSRYNILDVASFLLPYLESFNSEISLISFTCVAPEDSNLLLELPVRLPVELDSLSHLPSLRQLSVRLRPHGYRSELELPESHVYQEDSSRDHEDPWFSIALPSALAPVVIDSQYQRTLLGHKFTKWRMDWEFST
ncbi:hypothetical protein BT96DRAFT_1023505 [Gymnopus androsaceus JB14]|uniref:Uncharacterized protein n=1 Tax=Gymnopus androsaceus JB14 TaxID=1447944 RepID=A0A6A4H301_9AGAR|nr:hypothetical protein BT96DRAFT_1023505 [Gymnopus androsaceus JB14]